MNGSSPSLVRSIRGPITLITVGALFALNNFTQYRFDQTWPVLLIVFGLLSLLRRGTERMAPSMPQGAPTYGFPPPPAPPPPPAGGYRQSAYTGVAQDAAPSPSGTAKGGFGTSAPPRSNDPGQPPAGEIK